MNTRFPSKPTAVKASPSFKPLGTGPSNSLDANGAMKAGAKTAKSSQSTLYKTRQELQDAIDNHQKNYLLVKAKIADLDKRMAGMSPKSAAVNKLLGERKVLERYAIISKSGMMGQVRLAGVEAPSVAIKASASLTVHASELGPEAVRRVLSGMRQTSGIGRVKRPRTIPDFARQQSPLSVPTLSHRTKKRTKRSPNKPTPAVAEARCSKVPNTE